MRAIILLLSGALCCGSVNAQVPHQINYQGYLTTAGGAPVNATMSMVLNLYSVDTGGTALYTETHSVIVTNGVFNVRIGSVTPLPLAFDVPYWLGVTITGESAEMSPRQPLAASPYAFRAASLDGAAMVNGAQITGAISGATIDGSRLTGTVNATTAATANALSGTITGSQITGLISTATISGGNLVGNINAAANILLPNSTASTGNVVKGGQPFLHDFGPLNTFVGTNAGNFSMSGGENTGSGSYALYRNTTGSQNTAHGSSALTHNTTGSGNTANGAYALAVNTTGSGNTANGNFALTLNTIGSTNTANGNNALYNNTTGDGNTASGSSALYSNTFGLQNVAIGNAALFSNTSGNGNTVIGSNAGYGVNTGSSNAFFGASAGISNTTAGKNSFFGQAAGLSNSSAENNSFFGYRSGESNSTGEFNVFLGSGAAFTNATGSRNTIIGYSADVGANNLTNATAIGANALVTQSNSIVLGAVAGYNGATASTNVGIGQFAPQAKLDVVQGADSKYAANIESFGTNPGSSWGLHVKAGSNANDIAMTVDGQSNAKYFHIRGDGNVGINTGVPAVTLEVQRNGSSASNWQNGQLRISGATDPNMQLNIGYDTSSNLGAIQAGQAFSGYTSLLLNPFGGNVGINKTNPNFSLDINGTLSVGILGTGGVEHLCRTSFNQISLCSSSLRYKTNIADYRTGLDLINALNPITFDWKQNGQHDFGLGAEDIARIEPLLVTYNDQGQVEGVKYDRIGVILVNAVKEQQRTIYAQAGELAQQRAQMQLLQDDLATIKAILGIEHASSSRNTP